MNVCIFYCAVLSYVGRGLVKGLSPVHGILTVVRLAVSEVDFNGKTTAQSQEGERGIIHVLFKPYIIPRSRKPRLRP
jgi:hypothetical protein